MNWLIQLLHIFGRHEWRYSYRSEYVERRCVVCGAEQFQKRFSMDAEWITK